MRVLTFVAVLAIDAGLFTLFWLYAPSALWPQPCPYPSLEKCNLEFVQIVLAVAVATPIVMAMRLWIKEDDEHPHGHGGQRVDRIGER